MSDTKKSPFLDVRMQQIVAADPGWFAVRYGEHAPREVVAVWGLGEDGRVYALVEGEGSTLAPYEFHSLVPPGSAYFYEVTSGNLPDEKNEWQAVAIAADSDGRDRVLWRGYE